MPDSDPSKKTSSKADKDKADRDKPDKDKDKSDKEAKGGPAAPPSPQKGTVSKVAPSGAGRSMVVYRRNRKFDHGLETTNYHVLVV